MIAVHAGARRHWGRRALGPVGQRGCCLLAATAGAGRAQTDTTPSGIRLESRAASTRHALTTPAVRPVPEPHRPGVTIRPRGHRLGLEYLGPARGGRRRRGRARALLDMHVPEHRYQFAHEGVSRALVPLIEAGATDVSGLSEGFLAGGQGRWRAVHRSPWAARTWAPSTTPTRSRPPALRAHRRRLHLGRSCFQLPQGLGRGRRRAGPLADR